MSDDWQTKEWLISMIFSTSKRYMLTLPHESGKCQDSISLHVSSSHIRSGYSISTSSMPISHAMLILFLLISINHKLSSLDESHLMLIAAQIEQWCNDSSISATNLDMRSTSAHILSHYWDPSSIPCMPWSSWSSLYIVLFPLYI